jgi:hypothetical protein
MIWNPAGARRLSSRILQEARSMAIKGMQHDRTGHIGPDTWKNDKQNQQRGSHEKGEQAAAAALGSDVEASPDESQPQMTPSAKVDKGAR